MGSNQINDGADQSQADIPAKTPPADTDAALADDGSLLSTKAYERALLQTIPDLIVVLDADGNYIDFKPEISVMARFPPERVIGRNIRDYGFDDEGLAILGAAIRAALATGQMQQFEYKFDLDGTPTWWEGRMTRLDEKRVVGVARNITECKRVEAERQRMEEQMRAAQQLESLGVLAGGIAHDFNNLLVGIVGNAELALHEFPDDHPAFKLIKDLQGSAVRASELTNLMLAYAGRGKFQVSALDLGDLAREVTVLVQAAISKKISLQFEMHPSLRPVRGDATQLRQVIMNLVVNGAESIGDSAGHIRSSSGICRLDAAAAMNVLPAGEVAAGSYVYLEVTDTGGGMDETTQHRIFEPFFSTKFAGRGLGLAAVLGILRSHRGGVAVRSTPGIGSTFTIYLPPHKPETWDAVPPAAAPALIAPTTPRCVLIVDDEAVVRRVVERQLARAGYHTICAADGRDAVQMVSSRPDSVDVVLLDLTMPGLGGEEVLLYFRSIGFKKPVILMSGYDEAEAASISRKLGVHSFLRKPFFGETLVNAIAAATEGKLAG